LEGAPLVNQFHPEFVEARRRFPTTVTSFVPSAEQAGANHRLFGAPVACQVWADTKLTVANHQQKIHANDSRNLILSLQPLTIFQKLCQAYSGLNTCGPFFDGFHQGAVSTVRDAVADGDFWRSGVSAERRR